MSCQIFTSILFPSLKNIQEDLPKSRKVMLKNSKKGKKMQTLKVRHSTTYNYVSFITLYLSFITFCKRHFAVGGGTQSKYEFSSANLLFLSSKVNINIILRPKEVKLYTSLKWSLLMYSSNFSVTISHFRLFGLDYTILIRIITLNGCMTILLLVTPTGIGTSLIIKRYEANILSFLSYSCLVWGKTCYQIFRPLHNFMCVHTCLWFSSCPTSSL